MPQWTPFLVVTLLVLGVVLVLARHSQQFLQEELVSEDTHSPTGVEKGEDLPPDAEAPATDEPVSHRADEPVATGEDTGGAGDVDDRPTGGYRVPQLTTGLLLANVAFTQGLVAGVLLAAIWYFSIPAWALGVVPFSAAEAVTVVLGVAFGLVLWLGNELSTNVADAVGASYDESVRELLAPASTVGWVTLFVLVLPLIAFAEELLFRAALIGVPAAAYGLSPWLLAVVSSAAFALGHGAQGRVGIVVTGALGFVLAGGYVLSGSLLLVVVAHYVINAMEFFVHEYLGYDDLIPL